MNEATQNLVESGSEEMRNDTHEGNRPEQDQLQAALDLHDAGEYPHGSGFEDVTSLCFLSHLKFLRDRLDKVIPAEQMASVAAQLTIAEWLAEVQSRIAENSKAIITMSRRI